MEKWLWTFPFLYTRVSYFQVKFNRISFEIIAYLQTTATTQAPKEYLLAFYAVNKWNLQHIFTLK